MNKKRKISNINFEKKGAHFTLTSADSGGAASLMNDPFIFKNANEIDENILTKGEKEILEKLGESFKPILKQSEESTPSSAEEDSAGEDETFKNKGNEENNMATEREIELEKRLNAMNKKFIEKELQAFELEGSSELAEVLVGMSEEGSDIVIKALGELKGKVDSKAEEISKAKAKNSEGDNPVAEELSKEVGTDTDVVTEGKVTEVKNDVLSDLAKARELANNAAKGVK